MKLEEKLKKLTSSCERHWQAHQNNCSGFVKAVANDLSITISGQANDIVEQLNTPQWRICKNGIEARQKALLGNFVLGGLKSSPNGHIVVVVPGSLAHGKYPTAYWGSLGGIGKKNKTINWSWNKADRDNVIYAYKEITE